MNLHEVPAFTQNFSIELTCCVPEPVIILYVHTITKPESLKKSRENFFQKNSFLLFVVVLLFLLQDVTA